MNVCMRLCGDGGTNDDDDTEEEERAKRNERIQTPTDISFHCQKRTQCLALLFRSLTIRCRRLVVCFTPSRTLYALYIWCFWQSGNRNATNGATQNRCEQMCDTAAADETEFITFVFVEGKKKRTTTSNHSTTYFGWFEFH